MWHPWLPQKVCTFLWLLHAQGLPLESWLNTMDLDGSCKLCATAPIETARHAFIECSATCAAWTHYNRLRLQHHMPVLQLTPADILEGDTLTVAELTAQHFSSTYKVTKETPWDLLWCLLLRQIWCQRCSKVMRNEPFYLGSTMHAVWKTTIQIGVAVWRTIWKASTAANRLEVFHMTWASTQVFYMLDTTPTWHFIPSTEFLPWDLAIRPLAATPRRMVTLPPSQARQHRGLSQSTSRTPPAQGAMEQGTQTLHQHPPRMASQQGIEETPPPRTPTWPNPTTTGARSSPTIRKKTQPKNRTMTQQQVATQFQP